MSVNLFAYLNTAPALEELSVLLTALGLVYRHTLPADERWCYPMHIFGGEGLRVVYHAGDPLQGEAIVDGMFSREDQHARSALQLVLTTVIQHYGGQICDPSVTHRGAVL